VKKVRIGVLTGVGGTAVSERNKQYIHSTKQFKNLQRRHARMTKAIVQTCKTSRTHDNPHHVLGVWSVSWIYHCTTCDINYTKHGTGINWIIVGDSKLLVNGSGIVKAPLIRPIPQLLDERDADCTACLMFRYKLKKALTF